MSDIGASRPVNLTTGLPSTVLPPVEPPLRHRLLQAAAAPADRRRDEYAAIVADHPRCLDAWAGLGDHGRDPVERYAAYRVGYHRGLDALRANGWRGSGYVRWAEESNHGFLRCLAGLGRMAAVIGEREEVERIDVFLAQLDPSGVPVEYR